MVDPASIGHRQRLSDPVLSLNADTTVVGDVGLFDNDLDAEEDHVLLLEEVPLTAAEIAAEGDLPEELEEEESQSDSEAVLVAQGRRSRRRYCLEGCDCEKERGRLCECEKRGDGMCSDECQCNPSLCRATAKEEEEEAEHDEEEDEDSQEEDSQSDEDS